MNSIQKLGDGRINFDHQTYINEQSNRVIKGVVYCVYSTDVWHTHGSEVLIAVCTSKESAIRIIHPNAKMLKQLENGDQTQGDTVCYEIRTYEHNKLIP